jgi:hypothetical protein
MASKHFKDHLCHCHQGNESIFCCLSTNGGIQTNPSLQNEIVLIDDGNTMYNIKLCLSNIKLR